MPYNVPLYKRLKPEDIEKNHQKRILAVSEDLGTINTRIKNQVAIEKTALNNEYQTQIHQIEDNLSKEKDKELRPLLSDFFKVQFEKVKEEIEICRKQLYEINDKNNLEELDKTIEANKLNALHQYQNDIINIQNNNKIDDVDQAKKNAYRLFQEQLTLITIIPTTRDLIKKRDDLEAKKRNKKKEFSEEDQQQYDNIIKAIESNKKKHSKDDNFKKFVIKYDNLNKQFNNLARQQYLYSDPSVSPSMILAELKPKLDNDLQKKVTDINNSYKKTLSTSVETLKTAKNAQLEDLENKYTPVYNYVRKATKHGLSFYKLVEELQSAQKKGDDSPEFQMMIENLRSYCNNAVDANFLLDHPDNLQNKCTEVIASCKAYLDKKRTWLRIGYYSDLAKNRIYRTEILINKLYLEHPSCRPDELTENAIKTNIAYWTRKLNEIQPAVTQIENRMREQERQREAQANQRQNGGRAL